MAEKGPEAEFQDALSDLESALRNSVKSFAEWMAKNWTMTREQWKHDYADAPPEGDYFDGYNAGVESVIDAYQFFVDEYASN